MQKLEPVQLTPRLLAIAEQVQPGARLADIGTDHAHLPIYLMQQGRIRTAIASDIREGPLMRAHENAKKHGCLSQLSLRLGAGLERVRPAECDTVSIAGMGGETIAGILHAAPWTADGQHLLLLQPMTMVAELRQALYHGGYAIEKESICREEHHWYVVMAARGGHTPQDKPLGACCISPALLQAKGAEAYLRRLLERETRALRGMEQARQMDEARLAEQKRTVRTLERGLEELA